MFIDNFMIFSSFICFLLRSPLAIRRELLEDDIEIVRLALLWTLLLYEERPTAFLAFAEPNEVYVRLAEVLIIGR